MTGNSGHWLMEESPGYTVNLVRKFLESPAASIPFRTTTNNDVGEIRLTPSEFKFPAQGNPGTGSSGVSEIQTVVLKGDPNQTGVYTIMLRVPARTQIAAHSHRNDRVATVVSGTWPIGYGDKFYESKLKALPSGSLYTGPPGQNHFAETGDEPVVVRITGPHQLSTLINRKTPVCGNSCNSISYESRMVQQGAVRNVHELVEHPAKPGRVIVAVAGA